MTIHKKIANVLSLSSLLVVFVSLFFPYLEQVGFKQNFPDATPYACGWDFFFARAVLMLLSYSILTFIYNKYNWRPFIFGLASLLSLVFLRYSILYPEPRFWYDGIETTTAYGFHIMAVAVITQLFILFIFLILSRKVID